MDESAKASITIQQILVQLERLKSEAEAMGELSLAVAIEHAAAEARRHTPPSRRAVEQNAMRIGWDDLSRPDKAGFRVFGDGIVNVQPREIAIWRDHPEARFLATRFEPASGGVHYMLSTYVLGA